MATSLAYPSEGGRGCFTCSYEDHLSRGRGGGVSTLCFLLSPCLRFHMLSVRVQISTGITSSTTTVYVPSSELGLSHPLSRRRVSPSLGIKGGGAHSPAGEGLGESQFRRLEKSLALCLLLVYYSCPKPHVLERKNGIQNLKTLLHLKGTISQDKHCLSLI
jgi:hypothetical protein